MAFRNTTLRRRLAVAVAAGFALLTVAAAPATARPAPDRADSAAASYRVLGPRTVDDRNAVAGTGAAIDFVEHGMMNVSATPAEAAAITRLGFRLEAVRPVADGHDHAEGDVGTAAFPPADSNYHNYAEMTAEINKIVADHPSIARKISIGTSYEGRDLIGGQDLRQRRHRRERARGAVQPPPARPRAPDRRDGALPAQPVHRQLRHATPGSPTWSTAARSGSCRPQPGRRRVRHRHRLLPLLAQEPAAERGLVVRRHRPQPQLGLPVGLLRRLVAARPRRRPTAARRRSPPRRPRRCATS